MVISLKKLIIPTLGIILLSILVIFFWSVLTNKTDKFVMGSSLHTANTIGHEYPETVSYTYELYQHSERFQRPSKQPALKLKYIYSHNEKLIKYNPTIYKVFNSPEDVIHAYYAILKEAANMDGYCGGCGTIGFAKTPFPDAYNLLSKETQQKMTLDEFIVSFLGTGHTTLLKLNPAYAPPGTPSNIKYYMVEFEITTSPKCSEVDRKKAQPSYFAYYYGLVTVEQTPSHGWKIKAIDIIPEDFFCAPYHLWHWDGATVIRTIFGRWYKLVDEIEKVDIEGSNIKIYAKGEQNKYRFDAVRLTNGVDIFLHEYIWENGKWKEVDYIVEKHKYLKLSILQFQNSKK